MSSWLSDEQYRLVRDSVPVVCVDVVALRDGAVGLILRDTPHQGRRWCLIGGRVLRGELLSQAVSRHLRQSLGEQVRFTIDPDAQPLYVCQYFPWPGEIGLLDPRQHSVAMNYALKLDGPITAAGEAHEFRWFEPDDLPRPEEFGFQQDRVLAVCLARLAKGG